MPLFGPPDVEKLKAQNNFNGLIKALGYKKDAAVRQAAAQALIELGYGGSAVEAWRDRRERGLCSSADREAGTEGGAAGGSLLGS